MLDVGFMFGFHWKDIEVNLSEKIGKSQYAALNNSHHNLPVALLGVLNFPLFPPDPFYASSIIGPPSWDRRSTPPRCYLPTPPVPDFFLPDRIKRKDAKNKIPCSQYEYAASAEEKRKNVGHEFACFSKSCSS
jgi:hypothetical protein